MKYKVSNVCQLLDKSKYRVDATDQGITFTNNGDGSWTVVGTAPDDPTNHSYVQYSILIIDKAFTTKHFIPGHKIIVGGGKVENVAWVQWILSWSGGYIAANSSNINSYTITEYPENFNGNSISIRVQKGQTVNFTFKPQLFDLTEMYGVGNEPKTVAQFNQDFPDEYYEYSPECWKRIRELRYVAETKNLFDKSNAQIIDGYISGKNVFSRSSEDKIIVIPCLPNTTYTFSKISVSPIVYNRLRIGDYNAIPAYGDTINNVVNIGEPPTRNYITITTSDTAKYIVVTIGLFKPTMVTTTLNYVLNTCQLELGTTATAYQPYGYLGMRQWKYVAETKNLFDINANSEKGYYDEQGKFYPNPRFLCFTIDVLSNNTYCISTSKLGSVKGIVSFWNNNTFVSAVNYSEHTAFAYTVPSGANKLKFVIEANQKYSNIQIELGSTATSYQPYKHISFN